MKPNNRKYRINRKYYYVHLECRTSYSYIELGSLVPPDDEISEQYYVTDMHPLDFAVSLRKHYTHYDDNVSSYAYTSVTYTVKAWEEIPRSVYNKHKNPLQELKGLE